MVEQMRFGMTNCFLVRGSQKSILVDTGTQFIRNRLYRMIKNENISLIILTHGHMDHIANARFLSEKLKVPIAMRIEDVDLSKNNRIRPIYADGFLGKMIKTFSMINMYLSKTEPFQSSIYFEDNASLQEYGVNGKIIFLSGHTKGSLGVLTEEGEFIVGDAMINFSTPTSACIYEDQQSMLKSIERIKTNEAHKIYVGHGAPIILDQ